MNLHRSPNFVQVEVPSGIWESCEAVMLRTITPPVVPNPMAWWKDLRAEERTTRIRKALAKVLGIIEAILLRHHAANGE